jgi:hypothetical protein
MRALIDNTKLCFSFSEHTFSSSSSVAKKRKSKYSSSKPYYTSQFIVYLTSIDLKDITRKKKVEYDPH